MSAEFRNITELNVVDAAELNENAMAVVINDGDLVGVNAGALGNILVIDNISDYTADSNDPLSYDPILECLLNGGTVIIQSSNEVIYKLTDGTYESVNLYRKVSSYALSAKENADSIDVGSLTYTPAVLILRPDNYMSQYTLTNGSYYVGSSK